MTDIRTTLATVLGDLERESAALEALVAPLDETRAGTRELVQATLDLVRGLGLAGTISDDTARRQRILDVWARTLDRELRAAGKEAR